MKRTAAQLDEMLEKSVRLGATSEGADALSAYKSAFWDTY